jgi:hypothetical protein
MRSLPAEEENHVVGGFHSVGRHLTRAANRLGEVVGGRCGEIVRAGGMWVANLVRDLPERIGRLALTLWDGLRGLGAFVPGLVHALVVGGWRRVGSYLVERIKAGGWWAVSAITRIADLVGTPEAIEMLASLTAHSRPLSSSEIGAAESILGTSAVRWGEVRVFNHGALLALQRAISGVNYDRGFVLFHSIVLPSAATIDTYVHECVHVGQYETIGSKYAPDAIHAQYTRAGYNYGHLGMHRRAGKHYHDFNREQQAQIAQDAWLLKNGQPLSGMGTGQMQDYDFYITQLRGKSF